MVLLRRLCTTLSEKRMSSDLKLGLFPEMSTALDPLSCFISLCTAEDRGVLIITGQIALLLRFLPVRNLFCALAYCAFCHFEAERTFGGE